MVSDRQARADLPVAYRFYDKGEARFDLVLGEKAVGQPLFPQTGRRHKIREGSAQGVIRARRACH